MKSAFAEKVKRYYVLGLWRDEQVREAVLKGRLSEAEYKEITGKEY